MAKKNKSSQKYSSSLSINRQLRQEINARRKAEQSLFREKEHLAVTLDSIGDGVIAVDLKGKVILVNRAAEEMTGWSETEAAGRSLAEVFRIINEKEKQPAANPIDRALKTGKRTGLTKDTALISRDNIRRIVSASAAQIRDHHSKIIGGVLVFRDITERRQAEEALAAEKDRLAVTLRSIGDGVIAADLSGRVILLNRVAEAMTGWKQVEALGHPLNEIFNIINEKTGMNETNPVDKALQTGTVAGLSRDTVLVSRDGSRLTVSASGATVSDHEGKVIGGVLVFRDVTLRKQAEEHLKEAIGLKSRFVSTVSHEMRTPLTAIKEGIGIVLDGSAGRLNETQQDFLDTAKRNVDRLHRLINDVLDFAKLESGKTIFRMEQNDLNKVIREVAVTQKLLADKKGLGLFLDLAPVLPKVRFDYDRVAQVLNNLINNAIKFTQQGRIEIKSGFDSTGKDIRVNISDTGCGIKSADIGKLFVNFQQVGDKFLTGGTGLGLAICKEIIGHHNGRIWVESKPGEGSTFIFTLLGE